MFIYVFVAYTGRSGEISDTKCVHLGTWVSAVIMDKISFSYIKVSMFKIKVIEHCTIIQFIARKSL